jgi:cystathionine gamma-synthase
MKPDSKLVATGREPVAGVSPSLERSVTFHNVPFAEDGSPYARSHSPVAAEAERLLGELENAIALSCASGMTAWTVLCLSELVPGNAVAIPSTGYYGYETVSETLLERWGIEVRRYEPADSDGFARAAQGARIALIETPANPTLAVVDIAAAADVAHAGGALLACDNTVSTPLIQRPLDLGADITLQSATKALNGHSDTLAGVFATRDEEIAERFRHTRTEIGGILAPDGAWLLLRGMRTLALRLQRHSATALELARRLDAHDAVVAVHYPGLETHPGHDVAVRQMHGGFGGLLAFETPDSASAEAVERSLRLIHPATSLGSVETLIERRARIEPSGRVAPGLLRLSAGLEDVDDLWDDLSQALSGFQT